MSSIVKTGMELLTLLGKRSRESQRLRRRYQKQNKIEKILKINESGEDVLFGANEFSRCIVVCTLRFLGGSA